MDKMRKLKKCILSVTAAALLLTGIPIPDGTGLVHAAQARFSADMDAETAEWIEEAGEALREIAEERDIMALVYLADEYPVRSTPSYESDTVVNVLCGQLVNILDIYVDDAFEVWEYVKLEYNGAEYCGYVPRAYLAVSDSRFLEWEEYYGMNPGYTTYALEEGERAVYPDIEQFPESYRAALTALKEQHPNWTFVKMNTTMDWNSVISSQLEGGKSLVYKTFPDWAKNGLYDSGNWYYATEAVLKIYMDPRNSLTEDAIFQFEQLTYNEEYHTLEAMQKFLNNTFMNDSKPAPGMDTMTFAELFWYLGKEEGREVSPFHLAARVLQEQGQGNSPLISGTYPGYEGYYNYFNIGATGTTNEQVIISGLDYAKSHGWQGAYFSIQGGADFISANYIKKGQDTLYLQKFNVNPNGAYKPHTHQYMQNISAPTTEALSIKKLYANANSLDSTFVFKIPVYENMPAEPCKEPGESLDIVLQLPAGYSDTAVWLDGVPYQGTLGNGTITVTAGDKTAKTAVMYQYNENNVPTGMYVWSLSYGKDAYIVTPQPELENLLTYHGFSVRITGKTGIRFKTGINIDLRRRLILEGVNGYKLTEYGTLIMTAKNSEIYPMVKGGEKTLRGVNYGTDDNGVFKNVVYEAVGDRYRYTSVLTGLPVEQYQTDFAFRGYAVLEKDGEQIILYGPRQARSIYFLAKRLLDMGMYGEETESYQYLQKIVSDADQLAAQTAADNQENNGANGTGESGAESGNTDNSGTDATGGTSENSENSENNGTGESGAENENLENREGSENE